MSGRSTAQQATGELGSRLRDAVVVGVGFGVLGLQRAQVRRRALERQLRELREAAAHLEARWEPVLAELEERLPAPARGVARQVRSTLAGQVLGSRRSPSPGGRGRSAGD